MTDQEEDPSIHTGNTSESGFDGAVDESMGRPAPPPHAASSSSSIQRASLGSGTEGLVLFDLTTKKGSKVTFSQNCIKTLLDLKLLGIGYDRQRLTFVEIRTSLTKRVGENVTVPTLELSNGSHLIDSWNIAQYLYKNHSKGSLLFPTTSSRSFSRFMEGYANTALGPNLRPLTRVKIWEQLDSESKHYFEHEKIGKANMDKFRSLSSGDKEASVNAAISALQPIEDALIVAREKSPSRQVWLEASLLPTHADFTLYGWYVFTRVAGSSHTKQIWQAHSAVARWIQDMNDWAGPEITNDML